MVGTGGPNTTSTLAKSCLSPAAPPPTAKPGPKPSPNMPHRVHTAPGREEAGLVSRVGGSVPGDIMVAPATITGAGLVGRGPTTSVPDGGGGGAAVGGESCSGIKSARGRVVNVI